MLYRITSAASSQETEEAARSLGGVMCDCSPEKNHHVRMPIAPTGMCEFCGAKGRWHDEAVRSALASGHFDTHIPDLPLPAWLGEPVRAGNPLLDSGGYVDWSKAFAAAPQQVPWIVEPFLEEGMTHALWGIPGDGKSVFVLQTAVHHVIMKYPVLYVDSENHLLQVIVPRLKSFGMTPDTLRNLRFRSFADIEPLDTEAGGKELLGYARECGAKLVVIDTTSRFIGGEENSADTFLRFYNCTMMLLKRDNIASLRLDHPGKDTSRGARGSSAKYGDIDYEWQVTDEGTTRKLTCTKTRTGNGLAKGESITLRKHGITGDNPHFWHEWDYQASDKDSQVTADVKTLDSLGLAPGTGKKTAREALAKAGIAMGNPRLEAALRARKWEQGELFPDAPRVPTGCPRDEQI
jgi:hypothetical protein